MTEVRRLVTRVLPAPARAQLARMVAFPGTYAFARRVSRSYSRHYREAQQQYAADGHVAAPGHPSLCDVGVRVFTAGDRTNLIALPPNYGDLVGRIQRDLVERLSWSANAWFHPPPSHLEERTENVEEVKRGEVLTLKLKYQLNIDGLEDLCAHVVPEIERVIYGAYALVDKVYVQRTYASRPRDEGSWLWHFDQHPREVLKLLIYLTDVDERTAPFTYLASPSGTAVLGATQPLWRESRIPASAIESHMAKGCRVVPVTGPAGTAILFNDNVIHRGTFAERGHRDVLVLQLRPSTGRRLPFVDPRWTGSFGHRDYTPDPRELAPQPGPLAHRA